MAPRANWKGYLRLSLVTCPVALFPATSESEKVSFNQINKRTGHRIKYQRVDAETGEDVDNEDIVKGYKVDADTYIEVTKDELDNIALESNRTIDIDQFVPREEIDDLYNIRPYYIAPEGKVGAEAFVTIREAIEATGKVALGRVVLSTREHVIALEARGKGLMGTLLRYPYEVRKEEDYFEDIPNIKIDKEMLDLARHIVQTKSGRFEPEKFEDRYETALREVINKKAKGQKIEAPERPQPATNVINLMDALKKSLAQERGGDRAEAAPRAGSAKREAKKPAARKAAKKRKAG
jgi:DNA end-binding protein Ku